MTTPDPNARAPATAVRPVVSAEIPVGRTACRADACGDRFGVFSRKTA